MEELQHCAQFIQSVIICGAEGNCISFRPPAAATTLFFFLNATLLATPLCPHPLPGKKNESWKWTTSPSTCISS